MIKVEYKSLIITEMIITIAILKKSNKLSLQFSKLSRIFIPHFWSKLHQFFTKVQNSCCFVFLGHCSPTVSSIHCQKAQGSWLSKVCATMEFCEFFLLDRVRANLSIPLTFLNILLHLFWRITSRSFKNHHCSIQGTKIRTSLFFELRHAYCSAFHVDDHDVVSFWFGELMRK